MARGVGRPSGQILVAGGACKRAGTANSAVRLNSIRNTKFDQTILGSFYRFHLALPDHDRRPPDLAEFSLDPCISLSVSSELLGPELRTRLGHSCARTPLMRMPEAPVDENRYAIPRQDDVGLPREVSPL